MTLDGVAVVVGSTATIIGAVPVIVRALVKPVIIEELDKVMRRHLRFFHQLPPPAPAKLRYKEDENE